MLICKTHILHCTDFACEREPRQPYYTIDNTVAMTYSAKKVMGSHIQVLCIISPVHACPLYLQDHNSPVPWQMYVVHTTCQYDFAAWQGEVRCEQPNASLYTFTGNLVLSLPGQAEEQTVPLSQASLLLRGSSLRNTKFVYGAVVFAGHESKVIHLEGDAICSGMQLCIYTA